MKHGELSPTSVDAQACLVVFIVETLLARKINLDVAAAECGT
jgi:hypothetical protein